MGKKLRIAGAVGAGLAILAGARAQRNGAVDSAEDALRSTVHAARAVAVSQNVYTRLFSGAQDPMPVTISRDNNFAIYNLEGVVPGRICLSDEEARSRGGLGIIKGYLYPDGRFESLGYQGTLSDTQRSCF